MTWEWEDVYVWNKEEITDLERQLMAWLRTMRGIPDWCKCVRQIFREKDGTPVITIGGEPLDKIIFEIRATFSAYRITATELFIKVESFCINEDRTVDWGYGYRLESGQLTYRRFVKGINKMIANEYRRYN